MKEINHDLLVYRLNLTMEQRNQLTILYRLINENIRKPSNRGHTNKEILDMMHVNESDHVTLTDEIIRAIRNGEEDVDEIIEKVEKAILPYKHNMNQCNQRFS